MARIDWALLCESAFLDRQDQLCVIGIVEKLTVPRLPLSVRHLTLVARLADIQPIDEIEIAVGMVTPSDGHAARMGSEHVVIQVVGKYVLAALRDVQLREEGAHRFQVKLRGQPIVSVEIPVLASRAPASAPLH